MSLSMKELWGSSHISAGHAAYLESLYETYITDPNSLSEEWINCLLYTSPSPRDAHESRMPSSA